MSSYTKEFPVPPSLGNIMKDFASEVLRLRIPSDGIYEFGAVYFRAIEEGRLQFGKEISYVPKAKKKGKLKKAKKKKKKRK